MILAPGLYPRVRALPHPMLDTPAGFVAEVYAVPRATCWDRLLSWLGLRVPTPKRVYTETFLLPGMPVEVEAAYVQCQLDMEFGNDLKARWWMEEAVSAYSLCLSDEQLVDAMRLWLKIVGRMQARAQQHADAQVRILEREGQAMNFEIEVV